MYCTIYIFLIMGLYSPIYRTQNIPTNTIDDKEIETNEIEDKTPFEDLLENDQLLFKGKSDGDIGNILSNVLQTEGRKTLENFMMGAMSNSDTTNQVLSGISSILNQNNAGAALDSQMIANVLSFLTSNKEHQESSQGPIVANVINIISDIISQQHTLTDKEDNTNILNLIENPMLLFSALNSFFGPEAKRRESQHASHSSMLPPILEQIHLYYDHFKNTELYTVLLRIIGAENLFHTFVKDGKFDFNKFFSSLENKSFRKHWIQMVTKKITNVIAFITNSPKNKKYAKTIISLVNGILTFAQFPRSTLFDIEHPSESLTNLLNYFAKKYLSLNINAAQHVEPLVIYVKEIVRLGHNKGLLDKDGLNSNVLSQKLTNTVNLEIIEPVLLVWRAYRFAKKVPECDKYVICLINQENKNEKVSVPGLKQALSKSCSIIASWFMRGKTKTPFRTLYNILNEDKDCSVMYLEQCNQFHIEEKRIDSEYIHTEL